MRKLSVLLLLLVPTLVFAEQSVDFEIRLTQITGEIEQYPLTFDYGLYLPEFTNSSFENNENVSLSLEDIQTLNATHKVNGYDLAIKVQYKVARPNNPYLVPAFNFYPEKDQRKYYININGSERALDEFYVIVRTDGWGASTWTYDMAMDMIQYLVQNSTVPSKSFDLGDDGVNYHFEITRLGSSGTTVCMDGSCNQP